jgi:TPR repeat protein
MKQRVGSVLLLLSLVVVVPAWAGWDEMVAAYNRGDYATVVRELVPLAQDGDPRAQLNLGLMYLKGQGVPQDYGQALQWYRRAADQGDARAQYNLGLMYHQGQGVPQDYSQAAQWYRKAIKQGQADAQYNLGVMYEYGQGVPQDYQQAYFWYNLAAGQKSSNPTDHQMWVRSRDEMAARMTPAQLAQAKAQVGIWQSQVPVVQAPRTAVPPEMVQPTQTQQVTPAPVPKHCPYPFIDISKLLPFLLSPGGPSAKDLRGLSAEDVTQVMESYYRGEELRRKSVEAIISNAREIQRLRSEFCVGTVD